MKILRAEYEKAASRAAEFPPPGLPEVAFLGRSNVGKSSLLNRLVARKSLARTSSSPGKTRLLHWFLVDRPGRQDRFVDLPGYGYAKVSRSERESWKTLIESYLGNRPVLRVAILLQDIRRDVSDDEELLIDWLDERRVPVILAVTKIDKLKPNRRRERIRDVSAQVRLPEHRVVATSSQTGTGIEDLWAAIDAFL